MCLASSRNSTEAIVAAVNGGKKESGKEGGEAAAAPKVVDTVAQVRTSDFLLSEMGARRSGERGSDISHYISECSLCPCVENRWGAKKPVGLCKQVPWQTVSSWTKVV